MTEEPKPFPTKWVALAGVAILLTGAGLVLWREGVVLPADVTRLWSRPNTGLILQGNVEVRQVDLGFKVAGRIETLLVDEGDSVKTGQKLASLEKVYFENTLAGATALRDQAAANYAKMKAGNRPEDIAQAEATLTEQEATLRTATQTLDRAQSLLNSASGTIATYDDALGAQREAAARVNVARQAVILMKAGYRVEDIESARAQLAQQDAAVKTVERELTDADLVAPSDGVVESRAQEAGAIVNVGETVFVLSLTKPVWVRTYVSEPDLARIRPGMEVTVKPDSREIAPLAGRIGFISTDAEFTPKTVETRELRTALVYRLRVVVDDPGDVLRQGMPVTVHVLDAPAP